MRPGAWLIVVLLLALSAALFLRRSHDSEPASQSIDRAANDPVVLDREVAEAQVPEVIVAPVSGDGATTASAGAQSAATTIEPSAVTRVMLYGFVLPVRRGHELDLPVVLRLTDRWGESRSCDVGPDGAYSFPNYLPGRYWLRAEDSAGGALRSVIDLDAAEGERRMDVQLVAEHEIQVEVVDDAGESLVDSVSCAVATLEPPGDWCVFPGGLNGRFGVGSWSQNGRARKQLPSAVLGRIRLEVPSPVFVSLLNHERVVATQRVELGQTRVRFVLDAGSALLQQGSIRLRLVDGGSLQPLAGIPVHLTSAGAIRPVVSQPDGIVRTTLMPGCWTISLMGAPFEDPQIRSRIEPGKEHDLGDLALGEPVSISGMLVDEQGAPIAHPLRAEVFDEASGRRIEQHVRTPAGSKADGSFQLRGLARRRYCLIADGKQKLHGMAVQFVDTRRGSVEGVRMQLVPGTACMLSGADERWPLVSFDLVDAQGTPMISSRLWGPEPRKILLAPGRYAIDVRVGENGEAVRRDFTIGTAPLELSLP